MDRNAADQMQVLNLLGTSTKTSTSQGSGVDLKDYEGEMAIVLDAGAASAGSSPTLDVTIEESADNSSWEATAVGTFAQVTDSASKEKIVINTDSVKRYIRAKWTIGGTSTPTFALGVSAFGWKKNPA